jgi:hypothetical protein
MERVISKRKPQQDRSATHEPGTGYFKKGHTPIARGRPKGIQNRLSRDVKTAILTAAEQVGEDGEGRGGLGRCPVPADPVSALAGRPIASRPRIRETLRQRSRTSGVAPPAFRVEPKGLELRPTGCIGIILTV